MRRFFQIATSRARPSASLALLAALSLPATARAYCRTTTSAIPANYNPVEKGCITTGVPLFWPSMPVTFELNAAASRQVTLADATVVFSGAFQAWADAECTPGDATSHPDLSFGVLAPTTQPFIPCDAGDQPCEQATGQGPHQIIFRDDAWPYQDAANTIALTTVSYGVDDGHIFASNMEINSFQNKITTEYPPPEGTVSLTAIATHEAGHFVGMAHSADTKAVMYAYYQPGLTTLTDDDVSGICAIYPPASPSRGCGCGAAGSGGGGGALGLGVAGIALAIARARRRRRR